MSRRWRTWMVVWQNCCCALASASLGAVGHIWCQRRGSRVGLSSSFTVTLSGPVRAFPWLGVRVRHDTRLKASQSRSVKQICQLILICLNGFVEKWNIRSLSVWKPLSSAGNLAATLLHWHRTSLHGNHQSSLRMSLSESLETHENCQLLLFFLLKLFYPIN